MCQFILDSSVLSQILVVLHTTPESHAVILLWFTGSTYKYYSSCKKENTIIIETNLRTRHSKEFCAVTLWTEQKPNFLLCTAGCWKKRWKWTNWVNSSGASNEGGDQRICCFHGRFQLQSAYVKNWFVWGFCIFWWFPKLLFFLISL